MGIITRFLKWQKTTYRTFPVLQIEKVAHSQLIKLLAVASCNNRLITRPNGPKSRIGTNFKRFLPDTATNLRWNLTTQLQWRLIWIHQSLVRITCEAISVNTKKWILPKVLTTISCTFRITVEAAEQLTRNYNTLSHGHTTMAQVIIPALSPSHPSSLLSNDTK
jgi:hypothetical protein